jgi:hypothetical protein
MIDRRSLGDVGLAVLLALPTAALAQPSATLLEARVAAASQPIHVAAAEPAAVNQRFGLPG